MLQIFKNNFKRGDNVEGGKGIRIASAGEGVYILNKMSTEGFSEFYFHQRLEGNKGARHV